MNVLQRSFDDLGSHLADTTFVVVDLETTGGQPGDSTITEIGAVKVRGGELLGEFSTLVDPGTAIPPFITVLTGITDAMVVGAPRIEEALPSFLEFASNAVMVAHNASFDARFLAYESGRLGYGKLVNDVVCTVRLARRLVREDVSNLRLETLSRFFGGRVPSHRALADARACADVFHMLLELAGRWGVSHLQDLLWFQSAGGHPQARKRALADALPRARGVYLFRDAQQALLYVGKATDLRARVRSYFSDERKQIGRLLRDLHSVEHIPCRLEIEAAVLEARLIRRHQPPYNRAQRGRAAPRTWLRLTNDRFPRLSVVRTRSDGAIGPLPVAAAGVLREALEEAAPIRRCNDRIGARTRFDPCVLAQIGRCPAPCNGSIHPEAYMKSLSSIVSAFGGDPSEALHVLEQRMNRLSDEMRFEEAAMARDRAFVLAATLTRERDASTLQRAGRLLIETRGFSLEICDGSLVSLSGRSLPVPHDHHPDEARMLWRWLLKDADVKVRSVEHGLAMPASGGRVLADWMQKKAASVP